jgi:hypothetical protein
MKRMIKLKKIFVGFLLSVILLTESVLAYEPTDKLMFGK